MWVRPSSSFFSSSKFAKTLNRSLTLLLPEMVKGINEKMLYVFGAVNIITIPISMFFHSAVGPG